MARPIIRQAAASPKLLAAGHSDGRARTWHTDTWAEHRQYEWDAGPDADLAFSPDGTLAAYGTRSGNVVVWDVD